MSEKKIYPNTYFSVGRKNFVLAANLNLEFANETDLANQKLGPYAIFGKYAGLGLNFVEGDSEFKNECRIPLASLEDIYLRTQVAIQEIAKTPVASSDSLDMELKFVPNHSELRNKTVLEVAQALDFNEGMGIAQQLCQPKPGDKYAARNKQSGEMLAAALLIYNAKRNGITSPNQLQGNPAPIATQLLNILAQHPEYWDAVNIDGKTSGANDIIIYDAQMKTPNTRDVKDGYTKVYSLSIVAKPGSDMPIVITHKLGKGKPIVTNGIVAPVGIQPGSYVPVHTFTVSLTSAEWTHIIAQAKRIVDGLVTAQSANAYNTAHQLMQAQFQARRQTQQPQGFVQPQYQQTQYQQPQYQQPTQGGWGQ